MNITEFYREASKTHKVRIRPFSIEEYKDKATEIRETIRKIIPNKKKYHLLYTYHFMDKLFPFLNYDDMAAALQCTKANTITLANKLDKWLETYEDIKLDIEFINFKLNQDAH